VRASTTSLGITMDNGGYRYARYALAPIENLRNVLIEWEIASVITVVGVAVQLSHRCAEICRNWRDLGRSIEAVYFKAETLGHTLESVYSALGTRKRQAGINPLNDAEQRIWERLEVVARRCEKTAKLFEQETRTLSRRPSRNKFLRAGQQWKFTFKESAFDRLEKEIDRYLTSLLLSMMSLQP
jgi:hypothetical protein